MKIEVTGIKIMNENFIYRELLIRAFLILITGGIIGVLRLGWRGFFPLSLSLIFVFLGIIVGLIIGTAKKASFYRGMTIASDKKAKSLIGNWL